MFLVSFILPVAAPASGPPSILTVPALTNYVAPNGMGDSAGEPSIGVNPVTGNVMYQSYTQTLRVSFDDSVIPATASWASVGSRYTSLINIDPILFTDQGATPPRTFAGGLDGACSILAYTDNDGLTWTPMGNACAAPAWDHETVGSGPWFGGVMPPGATYDRAVYYCAQEIVQQCSVSRDGGLTFGPGVPLSPNLACSGLLGHVKVGPDGTAYVPSRACGSGSGFFYTRNNGLTWSVKVIGPATRSSNSFDPSIAITPSGWVYASWQSSDNHPRVSVLKGVNTNTWSPAVDLGASHGVTAAVFTSTVAGDDDRAAVAFLGTTDTGNPFASGFQGTWDLYVAFTYDAGVTWTTVKATTDPVQRGWICAGGVSCTAGRNLLDFMDATLDVEGRVLVAYADGCIGACAGPSGTVAQSQDDKAVIARQSDGPCLYAATTCGAASGVAPVTDCTSRVLVYSSPSVIQANVHTRSLGCSDGQDTAYILPGSDRVQVLVSGDLGVPSATAILDGLGLTTQSVTLTRAVSGSGAVTYTSPRTAIDPTMTGDLTVDVYVGATLFDSVTYRTVV